MGARPNLIARTIIFITIPTMMAFSNWISDFPTHAVALMKIAWSSKTIRFTFSSMIQPVSMQNVFASIAACFISDFPKIMKASVWNCRSIRMPMTSIMSAWIRCLICDTFRKRSPDDTVHSLNRVTLILYFVILYPMILSVDSRSRAALARFPRVVFRAS